MKWLKSLLECPSGEFYYVQTEGINRRFERTPLISELAASVADFRKGNALPRATKNEALHDIILFTVERLGPDSPWVFETDHTAAELMPRQSGGGCAGCGAQV